jgi:hypothetical protein
MFFTTSEDSDLETKEDFIEAADEVEHFSHLE